MKEHPITPPPALVEKWSKEWAYMPQDQRPSYRSCIATQAARWGADMEPDACCSWVEVYAECGGSLRAARRPKPPSLKEQALQALDCLCVNHTKATAHENTIRRALESLSDV